jgi:hypothetical protein
MPASVMIVSSRASHSVAGSFCSRSHKCADPELSQKSRFAAGSRIGCQRPHVDRVVVAGHHPLEQRTAFERRHVERHADLGGLLDEQSASPVHSSRVRAA